MHGQVPVPEQQHRVMIEAVENHMPEVIVIDEIGSEAEALAAATIAQRGVQLVATAHGERLENILNNPTLQSLLGGVERQVNHDFMYILTQQSALVMGGQDCSPDFLTCLHSFRAGAASELAELHSCSCLDTPQ